MSAAAEVTGAQEIAMTQDPHAFRPFDPSRINALDPVELQYWCTDLGCTKRQLIEAISMVGDHVAAVRDFLKSRRDRRGDASAPGNERRNRSRTLACGRSSPVRTETPGASHSGAMTWLLNHPRD
jgi:hypothetical protein